MKPRLTVIAVIIPLLGLIALIARSEFAVRSGPTWLIPITGYDPRDLLHGRYLRYQYRFNWQGEDACGQSPTALDEECCLCFTRTDTRGFDPPTRELSCSEVREQCDGWLSSRAVLPPLRYFVPEDRALELEGALGGRAAALELTCGPDGEPAIHDLYLDEQPWRDVLGR